MAHMIPQSIDHETNIPPSEKEVFLALKKLPQEYTVFHSIAFGGTRGDSECDFLIVHKIKGYIALEVKGGEISIINKEEWYSSSDIQGKNSIKNPVRQAKNARNFFHKHYFEVTQKKFPATYCFAICLPDCVWNNEMQIELDPENVLDSEKLQNPTKWAENLFKATGFNPNYHQGFNEQEHKFFLSLLKKTEEINIALSEAKRLRVQEEGLKKMELLQNYLLDVLEEKPRLAFQGAAGTGKTFLALNKAHRNTKEDKKTLILCFNEALRNYLKDKTKQEHHHITVKTFHDFCYFLILQFLKIRLKTPQQMKSFFDFIAFAFAIENDFSSNLEESFTKWKENLPHISLIKNAENSFPTHLDFDVLTLVLEIGKGCASKESDYYGTFLPEIALDLLQKKEINLPFNSVLVDEAQDFTENYCLVLDSLINRINPHAVYVFYDDHQSIFNQYQEMPILNFFKTQGLIEQIIRLKDNLRNTGKIHDFAIKKTNLGSTSRKFLDIQGVEPKEFTFNSYQKPVAAAKVVEIITNLVQKHKIDPLKISILSNLTKSNASSIFQNQDKLGSFNLTTNPKEQKKPNTILYQTIHKIKGLEYDIVILVLYNNKYLTPEMCYVGYTRAKHLLYVINIEVKG